MMRKSWYWIGTGILAVLFIFITTTPAAADNFITVTTEDDLIAADQFCSLREAIIAANSNAGNGIVGECAPGSDSETDVIQIQAGVTYNLSLDGADEDMAQTGDLDVLDDATPEVDVIVRAVGEGTAVVQGNGTDRIWHVHGAGFTLEGVQTSSGMAAFGGGLRNENGQVILQDALFNLNTASSGGAIYSKGAAAELRLNNAEISRNSTNPGGGGGLYNESGLLVIVDSNISGNMAFGDGGGLLNDSASASIVGARFAGNQVGGCGGGIANQGTAALTLAESEITGVNEADGRGGGLCNEATMSLTVGSEVSTNEARMGGGGIYNNGALTIRNSTVRDNSALDADEDNDGLGGGLYGDAGSTTTVTQSAIINNSAATSGGGVVADGTFNAFNTTLSDNFGGTTGGLFVMDNGEATLVNVTMADNEALFGLSGTGLHVLNGTAVLGNSIVANTTQDLNTCSNASGTITSLGHNLSDDESCFGEASDLVNADPLLAPLADGVRMPQAGSPVIDAANVVNCTETAVNNVDQLGQPRPVFDGCDIGAIEWAGLQVFLPTVIRSE